jgi:hypothetical protein
MTTTAGDHTSPRWVRLFANKGSQHTNTSNNKTKTRTQPGINDLKQPLARCET